VGYPDIAIDSNNFIHLVYNSRAGDRFIDWQVFYKRSTDGGATWPVTYCLAGDRNTSDNPKIAIDSNDVLHVVWKHNNEIYYNNSTDGGLTWPEKQRITDMVGASLYPKIGIDLNENIHIVWQDDNRWVIKNKDENYQILHIKSTDVGSTWSALERLTWKSSDSIHPSIALDLFNNIFVFWSNDSSGNLEIYRKKGIQ
jgi:hypothetical protein